MFSGILLREGADPPENALECREDYTPSLDSGIYLTLPIA